MPQDWILSIDFGTSNTAAAHTNPTRGGVEAVSLSHSHLTMPSSVYLETPESVDTGEVALDKAAANPAGFIAAPKRMVRRPVIQVNGYDVPLSTPVAAVLDSVVRKASREHNDQRPSELVLTHPEAWSHAEMKVLLDAAEKLGLTATTIRTVSEPKAAAHYYSSAEPLQPGDKIAVFDFGGGTLDVAVLQAEADGSFNIVAAGGDNTVGGKSFDASVRKWVGEQLAEENPDHADYLRREAPLAKRHALEDNIRRAKELLSETAVATIKIPAPAGQDEDTHLQLTREEFEEVIRPTVQRAVALTEATLRDAGVNTPADVKALYLTGGSARIPLVQEMLSPLGPVATLDDPKMVVAQGAISAAAPVVSGLRVADAGAPSAGDRAETEVFPVADGGGAPEPSTSTRPTRPKRTAMITAAVVAVVAAAGGIAWLAQSGGDDDTAAPVEETTTAAPSGETATVAERLTTAEDIYNALPSALQDATTGCSLSGGSPKIVCDMELTGDTAGYFRNSGPYDQPTVTYAVGGDDARRERAMITKGAYDGDAESETLESGDGNALAAAAQTSERSAELHYANKDTGLIIESRDFLDIASATRWLHDYNLL